jgi:hypothetical protein
MDRKLRQVMELIHDKKESAQILAQAARDAENYQKALEHQLKAEALSDLLLSTEDIFK